jgi:hypothetical protein
MGMPKMKTNMPSCFWGTDVQAPQAKRFKG